MISYVRNAFMWARHEPLLPLLMDLSRLSGGRTLSGTWSPETPSIQSSLIPVRAPARVMVSRLSDLDGRLMTKTFWNYHCVSVFCPSGRRTTYSESLVQNIRVRP